MQMRFQDFDKKENRLRPTENVPVRITLQKIFLFLQTPCYPPPLYYHTVRVRWQETLISGEGHNLTLARIMYSTVSCFYTGISK